MQMRRAGESRAIRRRGKYPGEQYPPGVGRPKTGMSSAQLVEGLNSFPAEFGSLLRRWCCDRRHAWIMRFSPRREHHGFGCFSPAWKRAGSDPPIAVAGLTWRVKQRVSS